MQVLQYTLTNFQNYIYRPAYKQPLSDQPGTQRPEIIRRFLAEYPLITGLLILSAGITLLTQYVTDEDVYKSVTQRLISSLVVSLIALPLAVVIEEAVFRLILRLTPNRLRNIAALLLWIPLGYYYHTIKEVTNEFAMLWLIPVWAVVAYGLGRYLKHPAVFARIDTFWQTNFRWIFYGMAGLYAFIKIINDIDTLVAGQLLLLPLLLLTGLLNAFYLGYLRMTYGFWYAVLVHTLLLMAALAPEVIRIL